ncbi:HAD family hydrolase [Xaviernesmea oryzae]|uniref:HAD family hydrolase n=1 Tax=Xaviernesmea oryzae TaxID=464029 RepID=A0A1Q9B0V4_9HYPH|nr:HAD family phosphatase [Xaviernesmea oryzae]OLP61626.1 HAD family hydrolase [Xaviernesmea oryzae]SEL05723.1 haloacid dehalogenase superfamily, subfamily IA, variant 3 with third motif having DD or ED [Xaviernesmea oryzae]
MPARFQAIAWDIDGTLVDSEPLHHRALVEASLSFGTDLRDLPDMAFRGIHMGDVWHLLRNRLPAALDEATWADAINRHYVAGRHGLSPLPGAVDTIRALHLQGLRQVCVSNSCRLVVDANLDALGIADCIVFSISLDDVIEGKPSPLPYSMAATRLGLVPSSIVAVEDSATGIRSAKAAGLHAVFLRTAENDGQLRDIDPDRSVDRLADILPLVGAVAAQVTQA